MASFKARIVPFELGGTLDFLYSAAVIRAIAEGTSTQWKTYNDSTALNVAYFVLPWKEKPGSMEVVTPTAKEAKQRAKDLFRDFVEKWLKTLPKGPEETAKYMASRQKVRNMDVERIEAIFRETRAVNAMVDGQLRTAIRTFAAVQLAGTVSVALLSCGLTFVVASGATVVAGAAVGGGAAAPLIIAGVPTGYSIITSVIKEWDKVPTGNLVVVSTGKEGGKALTSEGMSKVAETMVQVAKEDQGLYGEMFEQAEKEIAVQSKRIARRGKVTERAAEKLAERKLKRKTAEEGLKTAEKMGKAGRVGGVAVPIVFCAWDIYEGVKDFKEVIDETR